MAIKISKEEYEKKFGQAPMLGTKNSTSAQPTQSYGSKVLNAFKSGIDQVKSGFSQIQSMKGNPLTDIEGGLKIGAGAINTALSPVAPAFEPIGKGIDALGNKIAENPDVQKFAMSPTGEAVARGAEDIVNTTTIAGTIAGGPKTGKVLKTGAETIGKGVAPTIRSTGRVLKSAGEGAYGITVTPEESTSIALRHYKAKYPDVISRVQAKISGNELEGRPITEANTAARHGLMGTESELGVQATRIADDLWNTKIQPKLSKVKGAVNMKTFLGEVEKEIGKGTKGIRRTQLLESFADIKDAYKNVNKINLEKLQKYKEDWAEFIPDAAYKGKTPSAAIRQVQKLMAEKARKIIYKYVGEEGKEAYIDYGNLKSIMKSADKSVRDPAKRGITTNAWQFIMDKAVTPIVTTAGKVLYKTGEGLEFIGKPGAKKVRDIIENQPKP